MMARAWAPVSRARRVAAPSANCVTSSRFVAPIPAARRRRTCVGQHATGNCGEGHGGPAHCVRQPAFDTTRASPYTSHRPGRAPIQPPAGWYVQTPRVGATEPVLHNTPQWWRICSGPIATGSHVLRAVPPSPLAQPHAPPATPICPCRLPLSLHPPHRRPRAGPCDTPLLCVTLPFRSRTRAVAGRTCLPGS